MTKNLHKTRKKKDILWRRQRSESCKEQRVIQKQHDKKKTYRARQNGVFNKIWPSKIKSKER